jgi:2-polyprenyl-3-methyl-5-hydroxy-6-metoxy-1,4-benzoquinol methylase
MRQKEAHRPRDARLLHSAALRLAGRVKGRRTLDVDCSEGGLACVLASRGALALGIDASPDAIRAAERSAARQRLGTVEFRVADLATPSSLPRGPFYLITALHVLDLDPKPVRVLHTLVRLLHPRGRIVLAGAHPLAREREAGLAPLLHSLREAGLRVVDGLEPGGDGDSSPRFLVLLAARARV